MAGAVARCPFEQPIWQSLVAHARLLRRVPGLRRHAFRSLVVRLIAAHEVPRDRCDSHAGRNLPALSQVSRESVNDSVASNHCNVLVGGPVHVGGLGFHGSGWLEGLLGVWRIAE